MNEEKWQELLKAHGKNAYKFVYGLGFDEFQCEVIVDFSSNEEVEKNKILFVYKKDSEALKKDAFRDLEKAQYRKCFLEKLEKRQNLPFDLTAAQCGDAVEIKHLNGLYYANECCINKHSYIENESLIISFAREIPIKYLRMKHPRRVGVDYGDSKCQ